jgi:hypothetical protein
MKQKYNCLLLVNKFHNKNINWLLLVWWLDLLPEIHIRKSQFFPTVIKLMYTVQYYLWKTKSINFDIDTPHTTEK